MRSIEQASTDRPSARSARKGRPPETSSDDSWKQKITFSELVGVLHVPQCQYGHVKYRFTGHAGAPTFYLSSDSAGEPPHGFIGGVVFTSTPHLKGKRHSVSFNLQQGTGEKRELSTPVCAKCSLFLFVQNNLFLPWPGLWAILSPRHCDCHIPECSLHTLLLYGCWCWDQRRWPTERRYLMKNISSQSFAMLDKWHKLYASVKGDGTLS